MLQDIDTAFHNFFSLPSLVKHRVYIAIFFFFSFKISVELQEFQLCCHVLCKGCGRWSSSSSVGLNLYAFFLGLSPLTLLVLFMFVHEVLKVLYCSLGSFLYFATAEEYRVEFADFGGLSNLYEFSDGFKSYNKYICSTVNKATLVTDITPCIIYVRLQG